MANAADDAGRRRPPPPNPAWLTVDGADLVLRVMVKPRASKSRVVAADGEELVVQLAAPPVDGRANDELRDLLAGLLRVAKGRVALCGGETSRHKRVRVAGVAPATASEVLRP